MIQEVGQYRHLFLIIDSFNSSKFVLRCCSENEVISLVVCKLVKGKIEIGANIAIGNLRNLGNSRTYFNDKLFVFNIGEWTEDLSDATIMIQDLDMEKKSKTLKLKPFPSNVCRYNGILEWSRDHLFVSFQFCSTREHGIAFVDPQTCEWEILEFAISLSIGMAFIVNNYDLLVCEQEYRPESDDFLQKFYKLPLHKPESLRSKAWTKTVMLFKSHKVDDPYDKARQYLPWNSDIRGAFAADQVDDE